MALAAFAALVPGNLLELTPGGILNVHPSLLPRWRGAAPIQSALLAGDTRDGRQHHPPGAGAGRRADPAAGARADRGRRRLRLARSRDWRRSGRSCWCARWPSRRQPMPQDEDGGTYSRRIERDDARIDWSQPAETIWNQVRAYRGWPQAFHDLRRPPAQGAARLAARRTTAARAWPRSRLIERRRPWSQTGDGLLRLDEVQLEGKRAQIGRRVPARLPAPRRRKTGIVRRVSELSALPAWPVPGGARAARLSAGASPPIGRARSSLNIHRRGMLDPQQMSDLPRGAAESDSQLGGQRRRSAGCNQSTA